MENQIVAHGEAAIAGPDFVALAFGLGNVAQHSEVMQEPVNETVGGGFAVLCNVSPDVEHVAPRASSGGRPSGGPFIVARRTGLALQFIGQLGKRVVGVIGVLSREDIGFRVIERRQ